MLKKAWTITWRYKALWILGLFAGASSGSGGGGGSSNYSTGSQDFAGGQADQFTRWLGENVVLLAVVGGLLVMIGLVFWVLSIAAQGGLVHAANQAAGDLKPSIREAWGVGFSKWGRTFMIGLVSGLPVIALVLVMAGAIFGLGVGGFAAGGDAGAGAAIGGLCLVIPLFSVLIIAATVFIAVVYPLALRYGILRDVTFGQALKAGWTDLWGKKGAFVFFLVMLLPSIAFSVIILLVLAPFAVPAVIMFTREQYVVGGALLVLMALVSLIPSSIYGTFVSSAWTVFFREMTGMNPHVVAPVYDPYVPPSTPMTPAPPSAPVVPAPPAPPAVPAPQAGPVVDSDASSFGVAPPVETPPYDV